MSVAKLRPAVHVSPVQDGLLFVGWNKSFIATGPPELLKLWDAIFPFLHQGVDLDELVTALPEHAGKVTGQLLTQMRDNDMLVSPVVGDPGISPAEQKRFERTIGFLESVVDDPVGAFVRFRNTPVAIQGADDIAKYATNALIRLGVAQLFVDKRVAGMTDVIDTAAVHDATLEDSPPPNAIASIFVAPAPDEVRDAAPWVGVLPAGDHILVGPMTRRPGDPDLFLAIERRTARTGRPPVPAEPSPVLSALAGNIAAMEIFYLHTGCRPPHPGYVHLLRKERLAVTVHPVHLAGAAELVPHSFESGTSAGPVVDAWESPMTGPGSWPSVDGVERVLIEVTDAETGLLAQPALGELPQLPVPAAGCPTAHGDLSHAVGATGKEARHNAFAAAARSLLPEPDGEVFSIQSGRSRRCVAPMAVVGHTTDGMIRDAISRIVTTWSLSPAERHRFTTATRLDPGTTGDSVRRAWSDLAQLADDIDIRVSGLAHAQDLLTVVHVFTDGELTAGHCGPDRAQTVATAVRHACLRAQVGRPIEVIPTVTFDDEDWDPQPVATRFTAPGEELHLAKWTGEPALDRIVVLGWAEVFRG